MKSSINARLIEWIGTEYSSRRVLKLKSKVILAADKRQALEQYILESFGYGREEFVEWALINLKLYEDHGTYEVSIKRGINSVLTHGLGRFQSMKPMIFKIKICKKSYAEEY